MSRIKPLGCLLRRTIQLKGSHCTRSWPSAYALRILVGPPVCPRTWIEWRPNTLLTTKTWCVFINSAYGSCDFLTGVFGVFYVASSAHEATFHPPHPTVLSILQTFCCPSGALGPYVFFGNWAFPPYDCPRV